MAGDLQAALKQHIVRYHARGLANRTLYVQLWEDVQGDLHKISHSFWSEPFKVIRNILLARFGGLY